MHISQKVEFFHKSIRSANFRVAKRGENKDVIRKITPVVIFMVITGTVPSRLLNISILKSSEHSKISKEFCV